jgi:hypothetical protein
MGSVSSTGNPVNELALVPIVNYSPDPISNFLCFVEDKLKTLTIEFRTLVLPESSKIRLSATDLKDVSDQLLD